MSKTSRGSSIFSSTLGLFQRKPRKLNKAAARKHGSKVVARKKVRTSRANTANPYQSAEIIFEQGCACDAVRSVEGQQFLMREILPIPCRIVIELNASVPMSGIRIGECGQMSGVVSTLEAWTSTGKGITMTAVNIRTGA